ncbi:MAG: peptidoglycan DD-metalloendopeptidase family protein [Desulfobacteria bacterium]
MKIAAQTLPPTLPGGIEALRGRKDPEALRAAAREMESLFAYEMVKAMRATAGGAAGAKGFGGDVYGSLFDMELARVISARGLGLQEILLRGIGRGQPSGTEVTGPTRGETAIAPEPCDDINDMPPEVGASASPAPAVENVPPVPSPPGSGLPIRDGGRVSSGFGFRKDPFTGGIAFHRGMDIAAAAGTPVYPVREGKVTFSGYQKGYGNVVIVDHGDGFVTKYGHNRANLVETGTVVGPGTVLAEVGSTGRSTGPHLHFEVSYEGENVRPETVLAGIAKENG